MIFISARNFGVNLTKEQIMYASGKLWQAIGDNAPFYPDSLRFLKSLIVNHKSFYLITSSDCRLGYSSKDKLFTYDPQYSKNLKLERLKKFTELGIPKENIFIGDPHDKPETQIFKNAMKKASVDLGIELTSDVKDKTHPMCTTVMIGDSITNDLLPAKKAGIEKLIWINRGKSKGIKIPRGINIFEKLIAV